MHTDKLPKLTRALWEKFPSDCLPNGILVRGTALALHLGHRQSYDLDIAYSSFKLPARGIEQALEAMKKKGIRVSLEAIDPHFEDECLQLGEDPQDFMRRYMADGVKVEFFTLNASDLRTIPSLTQQDAFRIASIDEIAGLKTLLLQRRRTQRNVFDICTLFKKGHLNPEKFEAYYDDQSAITIDFAWNRLCEDRFLKDDPGLTSLSPETPDSTAGTDYLRSVRHEHYQEKARKVLTRAFSPDPVDTVTTKSKKEDQE